MNYKNITVAGSGVLGYQIAFQTAFSGFNVTVYDINDQVLEKAKEKFSFLCERYKQDLKVTDEQLDATYKRLAYTSDLKEAVKDADLLIEAVPENPEIKIGFYKRLAEVAPEKTVFATNSSTLLPSQFAEVTGRPAKFIALHFANEIWKYNTAEIMGHPNTNPEIFNELIDFAKAIGMVPLPINKEQPGYILNSLLIPLLDAATGLWINEIADPQTIDKTWMIGSGCTTGPFGIIDTVGITTIYNIEKLKYDQTKNPVSLKLIQKFEREFINEGKLGANSGEGFYKYPNPAYLAEDFLK